MFKKSLFYRTPPLASSDINTDAKTMAVPNKKVANVE